MKKLYFFYQFCVVLCLVPFKGFSQNCNNLAATSVGYESRCAATGSIKIKATGGSGSYKYRTLGPVNTNYTSTDSITGLAAGTYTVQVNDIISNCTFTINNVMVMGSYQDPRFTLTKTDITCNNGSNGSIALANQVFGRDPFTYTIVAPSPMGVGTSNNTGNFTNLAAGNYAIRLTDSCGGIQTRQITLNNYTWSLVAYPFTKTSCYEATGHIKVTDSRGNSSIVGGIPGFMYGIVRAPGDTIWSASPYFTFPLSAGNTFTVLAKDTCGIIKSAAVNVYLAPTVGATVLLSNKTCSTFTASLRDIRNFINGQFCLLDSNNNQVACNTTGVFQNLPYGNYCISAYDSCADTTIRRCFLATPPPISVGANVLISQKSCNSFTATITGQTGLTNPEYCLYDSSNALIVCNSSGVFSNLAYGSYCIQVKDNCRDTTLTRCFKASRPIPIVQPIIPSYVNCRNFGILVGSDSIFNALYCLYDSAGVLIVCNSTGIFDSLQLGSYCVNVYDSCYDTTIVRCFTVGRPTITNTLQVSVTNKYCSTFDASVRSSGIVRPQYCLFNAADSLLACNSTGLFAGLAYGSYCVKLRNDCPDTLLLLCFRESPPVPSVDANVAMSKPGCDSFTAKVTGQTNLTDPQYCLYNAGDSLLYCNNTGEFISIPYGTYCIRITDGCYDTTITRCFTKMPTPVSLLATASKSCSFNFATFTLTLSGANFPVSINIFNPAGNLFFNGSFSSGPITIDSIPGVTAGAFYKIVAEDRCGIKDSATTGAIASYFTFSTQVIPKCPGATWANGSGNIAMTVNANMGTTTVRITKKDNVAYGSPLVPNTVSAGVHTFTDMGPGVYILRTSENTCNRYVYDTVTIFAYQFPNLNRSSAYQCDEGGFSVSAVASSGVGPFTYQIIGSVPSTPSIVSATQSSSIFSISNGATYSLIRLRALDACGNATLGDASILPLTSYGISASSNCMFYPTTLNVDTIINANYTWYKKPSLPATDSVFVGSTPGLHIPNLTPSDTGVYVCYLDVNQGCIKRTYWFRLTGSCYIVLPVNLQEFKGRQQDSVHLLNWKTTQEQNLQEYIVERQTTGKPFTTIGRQAARGSTALQQYQFTDAAPGAGANYYRLKMVDKDGAFTYSNIVMLRKKTASFDYTVFPNPATDRLSIQLHQTGNNSYLINLYNLANQQVLQKKVSVTGNQLVELPRPLSLPGGMYILRITGSKNNEQLTQKIIFL